MILNACRSGFIARVSTLLLALHIFNLSIDPRDPSPDHIPENLLFNDIESVTEYFAEVVMDLTDAFVETDEADATDGRRLDFSKFYFSHSLSSCVIVGCHSGEPKVFLVRNAPGIASWSLEIASPPPKS